MLLQTQSLALTAAAVVREREMGTIEQILVTPIRPIELMIGKIVPYVIIAMLNMLTVIAIGVFWFGVPFQGSFWLFIGLSSLYVLSGLGLGLLISSVSQNQRQAQQLMMLFMMVSLLLGGFIFPRYTMPAAVRVIGNLFPITYFVPIARGIITKGIGFSVLSRPGAGPGNLHRGGDVSGNDYLSQEAGLNMAKSLQRLRALIYKETVQILRDRRTLILFFALPLIELFLFAYAVSLTVTHLPTAVVDQSLDTRSRDFIQALVNSGNFDITLVLQNEQQVRQAIDAGTVKVGLIIPPNFEKQVLRGNGNVLILLDGSNSFSVQSGYNAALSITQKYSLNLTTEKLQSGGAR